MTLKRYTISSVRNRLYTVPKTLVGLVASESPPPSIELLMVAGGGGGGQGGGGSANETGGGGAGGLIYISQYARAPVYTIAIGAGGTQTGSGGDTTVLSSIETLTALGGAGGTFNNENGKVGGSGSGGTHPGTAAGAGNQTTNPSISANSRTYGFGTNGGNGGTSAGGGGGGAGQAGGNAPSPGGYGGNGKQYLQFAPFGANNSYFAGGGVGTYGAGVNGGLGGGGGAGVPWSPSTLNGTINTGGGGGGTPQFTTGIGGSGIVILRWPETYLAANSTTGSPITSNVAGYRMYAFTGSGTINIY
jgi:hypothetical protein